MEIDDEGVVSLLEYTSFSNCVLNLLLHNQRLLLQGF